MTFKATSIDLAEISVSDEKSSTPTTYKPSSATETLGKDRKKEMSTSVKSTFALRDLLTSDLTRFTICFLNIKGNGIITAMSTISVMTVIFRIFLNRFMSVRVGFFHRYSNNQPVISYIISGALLILQI